MRTNNTRSTVYRVLQSGIIASLLAFMAISCNDVNFGGSEKTQSHMNVHLTDAPANYQEVNIEVVGLRIHRGAVFSDTTDTASSDTSGEGGWVDLPVDTMTVNLLDLTNGVDTLLSSADLDPGRYQQLRLILGDNNTVKVDGSMYNLKVPSGQQSGYKINFDTELKAGENIDVTIDFNASKSVHKAGNSGKYILKPVLKAYTSGTSEES